MGALSIFEQIAEEFFEGKLGRLLGSRLQPVHIANLLSRAVEDERTISDDGHAAAPNSFLIEVNEEDFEVLGPMLPDLEARLADYVARFAASKGLAVVGCVRISIHPSADVPLSRARLVVGDHNPPSHPPVDETRPIQTLRPHDS